MKTYVAYAAAAALVALTGAPVMAAPVAPYPPLSKLGKQLLAAQHGKHKDVCPAASSVAMPVYPGSFCLSNVTTASNGKKDPVEELVLVSKDSAAKVRAWYGKHLKGWNYNPKFGNYAPPGWSIEKVMTVPQVQIEKADDTNLALFKISYDLKGMRTLISVYYLPHRGGKP